MIEEEHTGDNSLRILNLYIRGHSRTVERISSEILDAIKIKKVNYREILKIPNISLTNSNS
jgi:hypothetical protein